MYPNLSEEMKNKKNPFPRLKRPEGQRSVFTRSYDYFLSLVLGQRLNYRRIIQTLFSTKRILTNERYLSVIFVFTSLVMYSFIAQYIGKM